MRCRLAYWRVSMRIALTSAAARSIRPCDASRTAPIAGGVPRRRVVGNRLASVRRTSSAPSGVEHRVEPRARCRASQRRSGIDDKIARARRAGRRVRSRCSVAHAPAREQRDLDRAQQLRAAEVRARRDRARSHPAAQLVDRRARELRLERRAARRVERRLVEERARTARGGRGRCRRRRAASRPRGARLADPPSARLRPRTPPSSARSGRGRRCRDAARARCSSAVGFAVPMSKPR